MKSNRPSVLGTTLFLALALVLAAPAFPSPEGPANDLDVLRERLSSAQTPEQWEERARALLAALDRQGLSRTPEAFSLIEELIAVDPGDPVLLWRRADMERRSGKSEEAIADLERLIEIAGDHPLGVRARRALPALYLRVGEPEKSAEADERLLAEGLADPVAVSIRLAHTYAALQQPRQLRRTLERLESLAPGKLETDPELMWLDARAAQGLGLEAEAAERLLRFANLHTKDGRRTEAMVRAAELFAGEGRAELALGLLEEVVASEPELNWAMQARLQLAELLDVQGRSEESRRHLTQILDEALDPATVAGALKLLLDGIERREGLEAAVASAASLIASGERFHVEMARNHLDRLMRELEPSLRGDPPRLLYYYDLLRSVEQERALSPEARLMVGALFERMGLRGQAATVYEALVGHFGPERETAHRGLVRSAPRKTPAETRDELDDRLRALAREEAWGEVRKIVEAKRLSPQAAPEILAIAARAHFAAGESSAAAKLLSEARPETAELAVLRGDARALSGDWEQACADYAGAAEEAAEEPMSYWLEWRVALCELRDGREEEAKRRIEALRRSEPGPPVEYLAGASGERLPGPEAVARAREERK